MTARPPGIPAHIRIFYWFFISVSIAAASIAWICIIQFLGHLFSELDKSTKLFSIAGCVAGLSWWLAGLVYERMNTRNE